MYLENTEPGHNKFILLVPKGDSFVSYWGKRGAAPRQTIYPINRFQSYLNEKYAKGYDEVPVPESLEPYIHAPPAPGKPAQLESPVMESVSAEVPPELEPVPPAPAKRRRREDPAQGTLF